MEAGTETKQDEQQRELDASDTHAPIIPQVPARAGTQKRRSQRATSGSPSRAHQGSATARMAAHPTSVIHKPKRSISPAET